MDPVGNDKWGSYQGKKNQATRELLTIYYRGYQEEFQLLHLLLLAIQRAENDLRLFKINADMFEPIEHTVCSIFGFSRLISIGVNKPENIIKVYEDWFIQLEKFQDTMDIKRYCPNISY